KFFNGDIIFKENDRSREMYIIQTGKMKVYKNDKGNLVDICELGPGSIVGEMSLLDGRPRSATVQVVEDADVKIISPDDFEKNMEAIPDWFLGIIKIMCTRLREADRRLKVTVDHDDTANVSSLVSMLLNKRQANDKEQTGNFEENSLDLKFAKKEIVDILSLSSEMATRALKELEGHNLIQIKSNRLQVQDKENLVFFSEFRRSANADSSVKLSGKISPEATKVLKLLYIASKGAKANTDGVCELNVNDLGVDGNKLFADGDFLKELTENDVVQMEEDQLQKANLKDLPKISVNQKKIANLLAEALFNAK
ncbi:MAG: hypothetical protein A2487_19555, partial [Candidatus Raymondbacteria bacterium RifOxyC12_full_50_8]